MRKQRARRPAPASVSELYALAAEVGECIEWQGTVRNGSPMLYFDGREHSVRRLVWDLEQGAPMLAGRFATPGCRNHRCIRSEHIDALTSKQIAQRAAKAGRFSSVMRRMRVAAGKQRIGKITMEIARAIRASEETSVVLAGRYGIHKSMAARIRRGEAWRESAANSSVFNQQA